MLEDFTHDINKKLLQFDGDASLKPCRANLPYTLDHVKEIKKCKEDIIYFLENYYYIINLDQGLIKPKLRDYQKELIKIYENNQRVVTLASRQAGKTSTTVGYILHYILFNEGKNVAILANVHSMAIEIISNLKQAFSLLPKWLQQGVKVWNERTIKLENKVNVYAAATSKQAIRGKSIGLLVLDELAIVSNTCWKGFASSVFPTISSAKTSKILITSTPLGKNHFYKIWESANNKTQWNGYIPYRIDWWQIPGRDEKWKEQSLKDLDNDLRAWQQEYGNSFAESGYTLIDGKILSGLVHKDPIVCNIDLHVKYKQFLSVYEEPKLNHKYLLSFDSAEMMEDTTGDPLAIQILDVTNLPIIQVASMNITSGISYLESPEIIIKLAQYYNDATVFIEQNSTGLEVANVLIGEDYDYQNVYYQKPNLPGYKTSKKTKKIGCSNLKFVIENSRLVLHDYTTIRQLETFVKKGNTYKADGSFKDDLVMSLIGGLFFMQDKDFDGIDKMDFVNGTINKTEEETETQVVYGIDDVIISADLLDLEDTSWMLDR
jgi:hypothetical protein